MSNSIFFYKSQTASGDIDFNSLKTSIEGSSISQPVENIQDLNDQFVVVFTDTITAQDESDLLALVQAHSHISVQDQIKMIVQGSIVFGQNLIVDFASENVLMGITQAGKTKDVADYLQDVMRYAQSGSLYEVINEIDRLKAEGLPQDLSPFVTEARLDAFKQQVVDFLS